MRIFLSVYLALLFLAAVAGCSSTANTSVSQQVDEIAWLPDESGMLAYIDKTSLSSLDGSSIDGQNLYQVGSDGTIGNSIKAVDAPPNLFGYGPIISVSPDGQSALATFINGSGVPDIYRFDLPSGNAMDIIQNTNLLGVSSDGKFAATTVSSASSNARLMELYDISTSSIRLHLPEQTIAGAVGNRVLWIDGSHFATTIYDSTGADQTPWSHVTIFDTTGAVIQIIPNAEVPFHASGYASKSGDLFVRTHASGINRIHLATDSVTPIITNDTVYSMDVSSDGTLLVYSSEAASTNGAFPAYAVNVANGHKVNIGSSILALMLSPKGDRAAYIHQLSGGSSSDIQVISVTLPN